MTTNHGAGESDRFDAYCQALRMNIKAALSVSGPEREDGRAGGWRDTDIYRQTGLARSTLRALRQAEEGLEPKPDLRTLSKLADLLGIPMAFLLMTPEDWELLIKAVGDLETMMKSADKLLRNDFGSHATVHRVLEQVGVFRTPRPSNATPDPREKARLDSRDERRRRITHTLGALMLLRQPQHEELRMQNLVLVALAASLANQIKQPTDKDPEHGTQYRS
ncbi:hypothetical protein RE432_10565 [Pusillimonas sp. SM2304]|uniref:hypothetical protein n=1 Tax=Pusillimonas sp. SM2304 TaxID=3073241 RepID=UPI002873FC0E|nr:hypothetical protein [Pusillimonas sp. SM2304]MDS1140876.1 hypothetical protein [Pusillimonas sp. SM2304]